MSQNESTTFLLMDAKNVTLIDATRENSPWCTEIFIYCLKSTKFNDCVDLGRLFQSFEIYGKNEL